LAIILKYSWRSSITAGGDPSICKVDAYYFYKIAVSQATENKTHWADINQNDIESIEILKKMLLQLLPVVQRI
jgi:hypothetical protein